MTDIYDKCDLIANHKRCFEKKKRILLEEHFAPSLERKPRGKIMFKRERIRELGMEAEEYLTELVFSNCRWESHVSLLYDLLKAYGKEKMSSAIKSCLLSDLIGAEYIEAMLSMDLADIKSETCTEPLDLPKPNPIDRSPGSYEVFAIKLDGGDSK